MWRYMPGILPGCSEGLLAMYYQGNLFLFDYVFLTAKSWNERREGVTEMTESYKKLVGATRS